MIQTAQSLLVLTCATSEATTSTIQPYDLENGDKSEESRIVAFELHVESKDDPDSATLTKIGDWAIDGPAEGIALHTATDGESSQSRVYVTVTNPV